MHLCHSESHPSASEPSLCSSSIPCSRTSRPHPIRPSVLDLSPRSSCIVLLWLLRFAPDPPCCRASTPLPGIHLPPSDPAPDQLPHSPHTTLLRVWDKLWGPAWGSAPFSPTSPSHGTPFLPLICGPSWAVLVPVYLGQLHIMTGFLQSHGEQAAGGGSHSGGGSQFSPITLLGPSIPGEPLPAVPPCSLPFPPRPSPPRRSCQSTGQTGTSRQRESDFCERLFPSIKIHQPGRAAGGGGWGNPSGFTGDAAAPCSVFVPPPCTTFHVGPVARLSNKYQLLGSGESPPAPPLLLTHRGRGTRRFCPQPGPPASLPGPRAAEPPLCRPHAAARPPGTLGHGTDAFGHVLLAPVSYQCQGSAPKNHGVWEGTR